MSEPVFDNQGYHSDDFSSPLDHEENFENEDYVNPKKGNLIQRIKERINDKLFEDGHDRLVRFLGWIAEKLPRIPMTESMEQVSFELQMNSAILVEKRIAESSAKEKLPKGIEWSENKDRVNPADIIRRGLEIFEQQHPDIKIVYQVPKDRVGEIDFLKSMGKYMQQAEKLPHKGNMASIFEDYGEMQDKAKNILLSSRSETKGYASGSHELYEFFKSSEKIRQEELFAKAMELANGHVPEALDMLASFTKAVIRPGGASIISKDFSSDEEWFENLKPKFRDQLSEFVPLEALPNQEPANDHGTLYEYSFKNRLGEIYHMWDIIRLTQYFTPEMVRVMVSGEYAKFFNEHGHIKLLSDMRVLADLYKIQGLFKKEAIRNA